MAVFLLSIYSLNAEIITVPPDDAEFTYGLGVANKVEASLNEAKAAITTKLISTVSSESTTKGFSSSGRSNSSFSYINKVKSVEIALTNVEVLSQNFNGQNWSTLIRVSKLDLQNAVLNSLSHLSSELNQFLDNHQSNQGISCFFEIGQADDKHILMSQLLTILPKDAVTEYKEELTKFLQLKSRCLTQNTLVINNDNALLGKSLKSLFRKKYKVVNSDTENAGSLEYQVKYKEFEFSGQFVANATAIIKIFDEKSRLIEEQTVSGKGSSFTNAEEAKVKATQALIEKTSSKMEYL